MYFIASDFLRNPFTFYLASLCKIIASIPKSQNAQLVETSPKRKTMKKINKKGDAI
jgi:hypothetical protein